MVEIKFKKGPQFKKLLKDIDVPELVRHISELCSIPIIDADKMVKSGTIVCSNYECNDVIKVIVEYGGIRIEEMKPLPDDTTNMQSKKENVAAIRIVPSEYEGGLAIESVIPIENHVFQTLSNHPSIWHSVIDQMPFVCGITQFQNGEDEHYSLLAARIPVNHNTVDEITSLSKVVHDVHTEIISTIYRFRNLAKKFNPFIDDVEVETRLDNSN